MLRSNSKRRAPRLNPKHELAVLLPIGPAKTNTSSADQKLDQLPVGHIRAIHLMWLFLFFGASAFAAGVQNGTDQPSTIKTILAWTPLLLKGFGFNILISFMSMAIGTVFGSVLGVLQISVLPPVRLSSRFLTQFFRNSPWLVLLFYCMFMLPFEITIGGLRIPFPDWIKAVIGLSLPVMANVAEIVRGAVNSIPSGQWEASESLAFTRRQQIWLIILPQCYKRMLPPWMNLYAILTMATVLASIVGVEEVMTLAGQVLAAEGRPELLVPIYSFVLVWFFAYCYPIARWTIRLESKFALKN
ncbi:ABC transporter, permease protein (cluster 3, basic aa/glutamine/opines) [Olavius sp. associated proteobacterium Delta 1]|nr:ABC transporter, permease protein (cluster 3, basic aa/glutamine/opines) [Olavius sp. associated proteobacterium Delta 1]